MKKLGENIGPSIIDAFFVAEIGLFFVPIWKLPASGIAINLNRVSSFTEMNFIQKTAEKIISKKDAMEIFSAEIQIA